MAVERGPLFALLLPTFIFRASLIPLQLGWAGPGLVDGRTGPRRNRGIAREVENLLEPCYGGPGTGTTTGYQAHWAPTTSRRTGRKRRGQSAELYILYYIIVRCPPPHLHKVTFMLPVS